MNQKPSEIVCLKLSGASWRIPIWGFDGGCELGASSKKCLRLEVHAEGKERRYDGRCDRMSTSCTILGNTNACLPQLCNNPFCGRLLFISATTPVRNQYAFKFSDIFSPATTISNQRIDCFHACFHHANHLIDITIESSEVQVREESSKGPACHTNDS